MTTGAHKVGAKWYFFAEDGYNQVRYCKSSAGKWYYITAEGERKTGLIKDAGDKYYYVTEEGVSVSSG